MLNPSRLPTEVRNALRARGHEDADIVQMTPKQAFDEFCNWHAILGWGDTLWEAMEGLQAAEELSEHAQHCTGVTATWCPVCGDCSCADPASAMDDPGCPLHAPHSPHAPLGPDQDR